MDMRSIPLANNEYYHIFNRGVEKRVIFSDSDDYERFLLSMNLLNDEQVGSMAGWRDFKKYNRHAALDDYLKLQFTERHPHVEIIAYCLNPNHFHFILKQVADKGIEKFMQKIGVSHTKYYNSKYDRTGVLLQGTFKAVHVDSNEYLLYLAAYVNRNNFIHGYSADDNWHFSSLQHYLGLAIDPIVHEQAIVGQFKNRNECDEYLKKNATFMRSNKVLAKYLIEES